MDGQVLSKVVQNVGVVMAGTEVDPDPFRWNWTRPMAPHTYMGEHICQICQKPFLRYSALKRHERVHTGERPYRCPICGKTFAQAGNLKIHQVSFI